MAICKWPLSIMVIWSSMICTDNAQPLSPNSKYWPFPNGLYIVVMLALSPSPTPKDQLAKWPNGHMAITIIQWP